MVGGTQQPPFREKTGLNPGGFVKCLAGFRQKMAPHVSAAPVTRD
jgi:hypothetical protein